ncbi:SAVED domain-containing protein [Persephonella sp.]|uniref:SAVED domain-containing protein n=1 Tax=Persephonella sp. TaxID=2060922 RepID=UPI002607123F|nr:SAVED domain-containing protein [Persephonella sp.]
MGELLKYKNKPERLKEILRSGAVEPKEVDELYQLLNDKTTSNEIKFLIWTQIKKREDLFDIEKLSKLLKTSELNTKKIFKSTPIEVKFPIALNNKGELATAYIIPLPKPIDTLTFSSNLEIRQALSTIKQLLKTKKHQIQNFFVVFDRDFTGKSFMLAVTAGLLLPEENIKNFAFTGVVNEEGEIFEVSYIPQKEEIAKSHNLKLITPDSLDKIDELIYWLGDKPVDIPFVYLVKRPPQETTIALNKIEKKIKKKEKDFSINGLKNILGIERKDLAISYENSLPAITPEQLSEENEWIKQVLNFEEKLKNIYSKVDLKKRVLHIGLSVPISLAMGLGIKLGTKKPVLVYHYQSDEYIPVIDLSTTAKLRKIKYIRKNIQKQMKNIEVEIPENIESWENVAVAIWLASHSPYGDVQNYLETTGRNWPLIKIESREFQGDIPLPQDFEDIPEDYWIRYVSEIYSVLNVLKVKYQIQKYHFFLSVPVPIAFALGMAIGHFWDGYVYNFNFNASAPEDKYYPVFDIKDSRLKSIF